MRYLQSIKKCPVFTGIQEDKMEVLLEEISMLYQCFESGETIYRTGDTATVIGIIVDGCLELKKYLPNGNVFCVFHRNVGEVIGGGVIFSQNSIYPYDVIATTKCEVAFIDKQEFLKLLTKDTALMSNMLGLFADRVTHFETRLEMFSYSSIQKKIAYSLLNDFHAEDRAEIYLPFTKQSWAEYLNVSRPSLSRELKAMAEADFIKVNKNVIQILDSKKLIQILSV